MSNSRYHLVYGCPLTGTSDTSVSVLWKLFLVLMSSLSHLLKGRLCYKVLVRRIKLRIFLGPLSEMIAPMKITLHQ